MDIKEHLYQVATEQMHQAISAFVQVTAQMRVLQEENEKIKKELEDLKVENDAFKDADSQNGR